MARNNRSAVHPQAQAIRAQVLRGIALHRHLPLHFPGHFLGLDWPRIDRDGVHMSIADGPHCRDANGTVNISALAILVDTALATCARPGLDVGARLATLRMDLRFTGAPVTGRIGAEAQLLGFNRETGMRTSLSNATVLANNEIVAHASGEFAALDPPPGVALDPLPWEQEVPAQITPLSASDLAADERAILKTCDAALARTSEDRSFIQNFWGGLPKSTARGARNRVTIGPHLGNRVGYLQGGVSFGIAVTCACAAAPANMTLSSASAWFIGPGRGKTLLVNSRVVHVGRNMAVVRTELKASGGARILEVVTHHVARKR
jgi:acyl-coenzyme A thioesterase PaaI-like protein